MIKVSVIIPIYNGEMHLRQCLDSVCNQTLKEIEIICVDDGSTDSSFEILKEYQDKDNRIQLYQQQNLYAGVARNLGKSHATGEYLVFWDCDDFFELNALEEMYNKAVAMQADVCVCGVSLYFEDRETLTPKFARYMNKKKIPSEEVFDRLTNEENILNFTNEAAWNKMVRRSFIENIGLDFQAVRNGNDVYFTVNALCLAERITVVDDDLVHYRKNQKQSLVGTISRAPLAPFQAWISTAENLEKKQAFPERSFVNKVVGSMIYLLRNLREREAFYTAVNYLKKEGLEKLQVKVRENGYYYSEWHNEFVEHLINDSIEDFQCYLAYVTYIQLTERSMEKQLIVFKNKENMNKLKVQKKTIDKLNKEIKHLKTEVASIEKRAIASEKECNKYKEELSRLKKSKFYKVWMFLRKFAFWKKKRV